MDVHPIALKTIVTKTVELVLAEQRRAAQSCATKMEMPPEGSPEHALLVRGICEKYSLSWADGCRKVHAGLTGNDRQLAELHSLRAERDTLHDRCEAGVQDLRADNDRQLAERASAIVFAARRRGETMCYAEGRNRAEIELARRD